MVSVKDILARGYFPKELPPPFVTTSMANGYLELTETTAPDSCCLRYSYSKYATVRRTVSIPNPAHFISLASAISEHWESITRHCAKSRISRTAPKVDTERALIGLHSLDELPSARVEIRTAAQYVVKADVANFYGSLYTHAIPWAFHTKATAKKDRNPKRSIAGGPPLYGNVIDCASRNIQSGQTIGLPVGPDTSLVIAESVLCEVDNFIQNELPPGVEGFRFVDDYEFACCSLAEAEKVRAIVQDALAEFELQVNPRKTQIIELPDSLDSAWVHDLAAFELGSTKQNVLKSQLLRYFSRAFELVRQYPGEPVLKYAVRRLSEVNFAFAASLVQRLAFQAATVDPGTLHTALYIAFEQRERFGASIDQPTLRKALGSIIKRHAPLQHGGDIAWALWGAVVFDVLLDTPVVEALERLTDPVAIVMALYAEQAGKLARPLTRSHWESQAISPELFDSKWLLVYEGVGQGWLKPVDGDPALSDPFFADARANSISFFDIRTVRSIPKPSPAGEYG